MKKVLAIILSIVMIIGVLAVFSGCGNDDDGKIKISIGFWPDNSQTSDVAMYNEWKAQFEADYPQYRIVAEPYTYSPETVRAKGNVGKLPTIFQTYFTEPDMLINNEYIRPITDQLNALGWLDKMDDNMREQLTRNGEIYGIPRDGYGMGMFINLQMMYDLGVIEKKADGTYDLYDEDGSPLYPTTFDEVKTLSELVRDNYEETYGMIILSANKQGGWQLCNLGWNFGAGDLQSNASGSWKSNLADSGMVKALEWVQEMSAEGLCYPSASLNYNDWPAKIGSKQVMMAFVGNDALSQPITSYGFDKDEFAFVPMPTGDGKSHYALFGGTPYVFAENATDEQVEGALLFLKYIGRSPETDDISVAAMRKGFDVAESKNMPILPTIKAWKNAEYLAIANSLENEYINVNYEYMKDFFDTINDYRRKEEPNYCQDMYGLLDNAIQNILSDKAGTANAQALLITANNNFQSQFLDLLNK